MGMIIKNKTPYSSSSIIVELTQAEYDALSTQEKNSNVFYCITDENGDEQSFQPVIYSTKEREVGVWTDGKPLYEKTLYVASGQINSTTFINMPTQSGIERLVSYKGSAYDVNEQRYYALPYNRIRDVEGIWILCYVLSDHTLTPVLFTRQSATYNLSDIFVTIQYTKVADTPGSGIWTTSGVPAVHYSENEHEVGTWIDGGTLYEKTLYYSSISASKTDWTQLIQFDEADMLLSYNTRATWNNRQLDNAYLRISLYNGYLYHYEGELANGSTLSNYCATIRYTKSTSSS